MSNLLKKSVITLGLALSLISTTSFASSNFSVGLQQKLSGAVVLYIGQSMAYVNNNESVIDSTNSCVVPFIKDERTLVPVRFISENLGAKVEWDDKTSSVMVNLNGKSVKSKIGSNNITVDGVNKTIDVPAQIINERTFIPLRALVEALGKKVFWDDRGLIVISDIENIFDINNEKALIDEVVVNFQLRSNSDFEIVVGPTSDSVPSLVMKRSLESNTTIFADINNSETGNIELHITEKNGKLYCKYAAQNMNYPNPYIDTEFIPIEKDSSGNIIIKIISTPRVNDADASGFNLVIYKNTNRNINVRIINDDQARPRINYRIVNA